MVVEAYKNRIGELVTGVVKRLERGSIYLDLGGNAEAMISRKYMVVRAKRCVPGVACAVICMKYVRSARPAVVRQPHGAGISYRTVQARSARVGQGLIEIRGAARDPGLRAKIAVNQRSANRSGWRLRRYARFARAGRIQ